MVLLVAGSLTAVGLIAGVDYATGPQGNAVRHRYLDPGGRVCLVGRLLARHPGWPWLVPSPGTRSSSLENPMIHQSAAVWNGVVRFGTLALVSSLVSRLHVGVLRERSPLARTDPLTGYAANARTFYESAAAEAERGTGGRLGP